MCRLAIRIFLVATAMVVATGPLAAQEVVDRIVARVENDVILLSDIRALSRYQQFLCPAPVAPTSEFSAYESTCGSAY